MGGFAADDQQWDQCALYTCDGVINDCVIALHAIGNINFFLFLLITQLPQLAIVAQLNKLKVIVLIVLVVWMPCALLNKKQVKPILRSDRGNISLTIINHEKL